MALQPVTTVLLHDFREFGNNTGAICADYSKNKVFHTNYVRPSGRNSQQQYTLTIKVESRCLAGVLVNAMFNASVKIRSGQLFYSIFSVELINENFLGKPLRLEANMAGWQALFLDNQLVSQRAATATADDTENETISHQFDVLTEQGQISCQLEMKLGWQPFKLDYQLFANNEEVLQGSNDGESLNRSIPQEQIPVKQKIGIIGLASLGLKLLKSAKVFKALLAVGSLAAYSWLFSFQFALVLLGCLIFHEYGHIRAMKHFGFPTKGIFLIPFVGGLAVSDSRINTRWQAVVIAIMGPTFGLFLSVVALVLYYITGHLFFAAIASFNALLNLFNLLPVLPLDGGRLLQAITFSMHNLVGLVLCIAGALLGVYLSYTFGLALLGFILLIGTLEIVMEWRFRKQSLLLPLDRYGQIFSTVWYVATVAAFIAVIALLASTGDELLSLPREILNT